VGELMEVEQAMQGLQGRNYKNEEKKKAGTES
jgi:hypothetical protein